MSFLTQAVVWLSRGVVYIALTMGIGAVVGMILYPLGAVIFGTGEQGWSGVLLLGLKHGLQWTGIWATGLALILCFMEWRSRQWTKSHN